MILSLIVIVLLGLIAYFHYTQGLFSATVSAVCAAVAALSAFAYHEMLAGVGGGAMGAYGDAVALVAIFACVYLVLRWVIDNFFPGNVRYPVALDKVGSAVMGLIAGFFACGIIALAAKQLPFGPSIAMHSHYPTETQEVSAPRRLAPFYKLDLRRTGSDMMEYPDVVTVDRLGTEEARMEASGLWLPVDQWFVSLASRLSDSGAGALAGPVDFERVYPEGEEGYLDALFARRIGIQKSAQQAAVNVGDDQEVSLAPNGGIFRLGTGSGEQFEGGVPQVAGEDWARRSDPAPQRTPDEGSALIVVRVLFSRDAADKGSYVRFGGASARLVAGGEQYFPIGTLESGQVLVVSAPDDYLLATEGADLVFEVDADSALINDGRAMAEDAFLEFKERARIDLGGERVYQYITPTRQTHLLRKRTTKERIGQRYLNADPPYTSPDGFIELRAGVPAQPISPAEAEERFLAGEDPATRPAGEAEEDLDEAANTPEPAQEQDSGGILDSLRGESQRRNELLE